MVEVVGNLWTYPADWRCITTNGFVKKNGECVMGRGCAKEASKKWPTLPKDLGDSIKKHGNVIGMLPEINLIVFPVKHNWFEKADLELIQESAQGLFSWTTNPKNELYQKEILLPRPGCGNGQLKWEDVKPILEFLPDNVKVITF